MPRCPEQPEAYNFTNSLKPITSPTYNNNVRK